MAGRFTILALVVLASASGAEAADPSPICADRPGKATSTCVVAQGHWQIETGFADWTLQKGDGERDTSIAIGETTVKYGLTDRSNVEVDLAPWQRATSRSGGIHESASGFGDVNVLYKRELTSPGSAVQVDLLPLVKIPVANHSLGNGKWEGGLLVPVGFAIPGSPLAIALTPEMDWVADADGEGHHAGMTQVVSLGWQATAKLNFSTELWGEWDWDPAGTVRQASADGAVAYLVGDDVQLDAGANFGLNRMTPGVELYTGLSVRF